MRKVAVALGVVVAVASIGAGGAAVWARVAMVLQPHGINFEIHTTSDPNFCLNSPGDGTILVASCVPEDNMHFTMTNNADGTILVIDGQGKCLDRGDGKPGTPLTTTPCTFGPTQLFRFTLADKLADPAGKVCVSVERATQDAAVFDNGCHRVGSLNTFSLSR